MGRCCLIIPYNCGWVIHRILNLLILFSSLFLWYLIFTHQEALHWYFTNETPKCVEISGDQNSQVGDLPGDQNYSNHGNQPVDQNRNHGNQVEHESHDSQSIVEVKKGPTTVRNKFKSTNDEADHSSHHGNHGPSHIQPESRDIQERFKDRNNLIKTVCESNNYPDFAQSNMYHFPALKATWLPLFGACSTIWKTFFINQYTNKRRDYNLGYLGKYLLQYKAAKKGGEKTRSFSVESGEQEPTES